MKKTIAIIGAGPAGLMAAEVLSAAGVDVSVFERKPSIGRKFLMAGRGGLNLTHTEDFDSFIQKYGSKADALRPLIQDFTPQDLRNWCVGLGEKTFVGSSGRVFPESFKASPLLRAWKTRLENQGVTFLLNHDWQGWQESALSFQTAQAPLHITPDATLLALGGASWPRLGADGSWMDILAAQKIDTAPLRPANCGFNVAWSSVFAERFAGQPLKSVVFSFQDQTIHGECIVTEKGLEGGAIYALSATLRDEVERNGTARLMLDLKPELDLITLQQRLQKPRAALSLSNYLRKTLNLSPLVIGLLMERHDRQQLGKYSPAQLAQCLKACPIDIQNPFGITRAISTAGGVLFSSVDENFMLLKKPGVFVAGEMLDWEAPTGGYLLQACMANGVAVAKGMLRWLSQ